MIRLNQQRLIRQRLPVRFLTITLLVALLWFIVMFLYVDDLISEQTHGTRRHVIRKRAPTNERSSSSDDGMLHDTGDSLVVYDHDTGRRLEVERVEDEYVEIWEHGKWVRGTDPAYTSIATSSSPATSPTSMPDTPRPIPKVLSPYSRIRKKAEPQRKEQLNNDDNNNVINNHNNNAVNHREDDFILLDEDAVSSKDTRQREPLVPAHSSTSAQSSSLPDPVTPSTAERLLPGMYRGGGGDDFHFAAKEILPTTIPSSVPKYQNISLSRVTHTKSSTVDHPPLRFQPTSPVGSMLTQSPVRRVVKTSRRFSNPKSARLRHSLVEPHQLPLPKHSGSSRRSAPGARRTKHSRGPYVDPPHININAKAGSRINYVNINKKTISSYQHTMNNRINNLGINITNDINNSKAVRLKWVQSQPVQTLGLPMNVTVPSSAQHDMAPKPTGRASQSGVLYYSQSVQKAAAEEAPSLDFQLDVKDGYGRHSFNVSASNTIPLVRELPDTRPKSCLLSPTTPASPVLPLATVVICFHNEAWSTLLRTIHSVLSRSPAHLLKEVILVDDYSSYDYLGARLETYISSFPQIQLVRTHKREGLIRARLLGVSYARGDVLVFLDSHCECNRQWLEPLLYAITQDRNKIACPQIDIINPDSLGYEGAPPRLHGGFNWHLQFVWKEVPDHQGAIRASERDPIRTPTMIGGLFAVNRRYFLDIGAYDPGMEIWGSENLELSFRVWMCGGSIDILPCSRVGHLFRPVIPYGFPNGARTTLHQNAMRVAEVWMDHYKKFYYASQDMPRNPAVLASLADRHQLRQSLACNDFSWYLKNIVPEMDIPPLNGQFYGQLRSKKLQLCVHSVDNIYNNTLQMANCQHHLYRQQFAVTAGGEMVHYFQCVYIWQEAPMLNPCGKVPLVWSVTKEGQVVASDSTKAEPLCLDIEGVSVVMAMCDVNKASQLWTFTYRFDINKLNINY